MTEPRRDFGTAGIYLFFGGVLIGSGLLVDWLATDSTRVPGVWLLVERVSGRYGWISWFTLLGLAMFAGGGHDLALHGGGRWLRRVPGWIVAAGLGVLAWYGWGADRYVQVGCAVLIIIGTVGDPQRVLPEARAVQRS